MKIGSGATPRGGKDAYNESGEYSLVRSQNILDFTFSKYGLAFINEDQASKLNNVALEERDILLNITGDSVARVCQIPKEILPARVNQHVAIIRPNPNILNPEFLKYYLLNPKFKEYMLMLSSSGATRNAITKGMIEEFEIEAPDLPTQKAIAEILSSLDDKIELNNQINQNLEALAQAIFKQWFVNFEFPNENGEPYKSSGGEMVDSELGEIPKGWKIGSLGELAKVSNGYAFKSRDFQDSGENAVLKIKNINGKVVDVENTQFIPYSVAKTVNEKFKISEGEILIAMTGAEVGKIGITPMSKNSLFLNQRVGKFIPSISDSEIFIFTFFNSFNLTEEVRSRALGSAQPNISSNGIDSIKCIIPNPRIIDEFIKIVGDSYPIFLNNWEENQNLKNLRDTLLPKLISGELKVNQFEKEVYG